ncbi:MAG: F0F1 ATP synthase subunit alpha, partial [Clostridia bacterium]|nr:F0F1 ATP synthase subunit alpha [Clostridia bacterium]
SRGERMVELLKQDQYKPMDVSHQVVSIFVGANGYLDDLPVEEVLRFEEEFLAHLLSEHPEILSDIKEQGEITDDTDAELRKIIEGFKKDQFKVED